jgi:exodeoxyribonuclease VII large subunit
MSLFSNSCPNEPSSGAATDSDEGQVLSVSDLTRDIQSSLQANFSSVWVTGEVSDLARPSSGHLYLTLKDDNSQIRAVIWKSTAQHIRFPLDDGTQLLCRGDVDVYPPRGTYQLIIRQVEPRGEGALQAALRQLRAKLAAEGLFAPQWKQPIPKFPKRVGVITSPSGAALRDFLQVATRRCPGVELVILPSRMQGAGSADEVIQAIATAHQLQPPIDTLVITRGGGSIEDLWSFNEEKVVRAIHAAHLPIVSAIGHEIDVTLADLVADLRALTPSEAAERVIPSANEMHAALDQLGKRLHALMRARTADSRQRLESLASRRVLLHPKEYVRLWALRVDDLQLRGQRAMVVNLRRHRDRLLAVSARLESLSPLSVLKRGYSVTIRDNKVVRSIDDVNVGDLLTTKLNRGNIVSRVQSIAPEDADEAASIPPQLDFRVDGSGSC